MGDYSNWESTGETYDFTNQITGPVYLTAKGLSESNLSVAYDLAGGIGSIADGSHYLDLARRCRFLVTAPTKDGYQFIGWKVEGDEEGLLPRCSGGTLELNKANQDKNNDNTVTLTAVYDQVSNVTLTFHANAADATVTPESKTLAKNEAFNLSGVTVSRSGYEFAGWSKEADGDVDFAPNAVVATDMDDDLFAVWDKTDNYNFVVDFNGKMTIANEATAKKDDTHNNGVFDVAASKATYQLKNAEDTFTNGANLAFSGVDTALINGVPVGAAEGTTASWEKYTVVPANTVYFDDSLAGKSMTVGDGSGFNAAVKANESTPTEGQSNTSITFTFNGNGIDVYCTTDTANGWIQATVDGTNKQPYTNTRFRMEKVPHFITFRRQLHDLGEGRAHPPSLSRR